MSPCTQENVANIAYVANLANPDVRVRWRPLTARTLVAGFVLILSACAVWAGQPDADDLLRRPAFTWVVDTTDHFVLHIEKGTRAEKSADLLGFQLDRARERALDLLSEKNYEPRINVFVVGSRSRMQKLVGRSIVGIAYHNTKVIALVSGDSVSGSPIHEVFHAMAMSTWGLGPTWLNEGMSVYAAGAWQGRDLHSRARDLRDHNELFPLDRLTHDFRALDPRIAYPQAGSFVRFLREHYNPAALHALWVGNDAEFTRLAGIDLAAADRLWRDSLR